MCFSDERCSDRLPLERLFLLRDGIYELRARDGNVHYRILYGFVGQNIVLLSHGCTKERAVPNREIDRAVKNLALFKGNPVAHTAQGGI